LTTVDESFRWDVRGRRDLTSIRVFPHAAAMHRLNSLRLFTTSCFTHIIPLEFHLHSARAPQRSSQMMGVVPHQAQGAPPRRLRELICVRPKVLCCAGPRSSATCRGAAPLARGAVPPGSGCSAVCPNELRHAGLGSCAPASSGKLCRRWENGARSDWWIG
jgi:hypothetical protein